VKSNRLFLLVAAAAVAALLRLCGPAIGEVTVNPIGFAVSMENGDTLVAEMTLTNDAEIDIAYEIGFDEPERDDLQGRGPRRDQPEGLFAVFQDTSPFGWVEENVFRNVEGENFDYDNYNQARDLIDVELFDYDAIWVQTGDQSAQFVQNWDENLGRFEEYIDHGHAMFIEEGYTGNHPGPIIGGLNDVREPQNGRLIVGPDDNWLVGQMDRWREGQIFPGDWMLHSVYPEDSLEEIENCDWFQVIVESEDSRVPGVIVYNYGRGHVVVSGSPCGHQWQNYRQPDRWGGCYEQLLEWLIILGSSDWIAADPEEGVIPAEDSESIDIIFTPVELEAGVYEMLIRIELAEAEARDDLEEPLIEIAAVMSVESPVASIAGVITDAATQEAVVGAGVDLDYYIISSFSDEEGDYAIESLPLREYELTFNATDYLPTVEPIDLDDDLALDVALLHSECTPDLDSIYRELPINGETLVDMVVSNSGNGPLTYTVELFKVDASCDWMAVDPDEGVIGAEQTQQFELTLSSRDLAEAVFEGEIVFMHDGVGGETPIGVTMKVDQGVINTRTLQLDMGWNLVSANLQPDTTDVTVLTRELVDAGLLVMMKDGEGHFYRPDYDYNDIPGWSVDQGYQVRMAGRGQLTLEGMAVMRDDTIQLHEGWQLVSYYPRLPVDAPVVLSRIEEHLTIAKDGFGDFYLPAWGFCNMSPMCEGRGYQLKVDTDLELVYAQQMEELWAGGGGFRRQVSVYTESGLLPVHPHTGSNMSLLVISDAQSDEAEIGVYASGNLVGSGVLQDGACGIAVWGDDPATAEVDGALEGQPLELYITGRLDTPVPQGPDRNVGPTGLWPVSFTILEGQPVYRTDGLLVVRLEGSPAVTADFEIVSIHPNPFNATTTITYDLPFATRVSLEVFNLSGRRVEMLFEGYRQPGIYTRTLTATDLPSGLYFVRLEASERALTQKVMLIK